MEEKGDLKENLSSDGEDSEDNSENETEIDDKFSQFAKAF